MRRKRSTARRTALSPSHGVAPCGGSAHVDPNHQDPLRLHADVRVGGARRTRRSRRAGRREPASPYSSPPGRSVPRPARRRARPRPRRCRRTSATASIMEASADFVVGRRGRTGARPSTRARTARDAWARRPGAVQHQAGRPLRPAPPGSGGRRSPSLDRRALRLELTRDEVGGQPDPRAARRVAADQPLGQQDLIHPPRISEPSTSRWSARRGPVYPRSGDRGPAQRAPAPRRRRRSRPPGGLRRGSGRSPSPGRSRCHRGLAPTRGGAGGRVRQPANRDGAFGERGDGAYRTWAWELAARGLAVLRYDKRGRAKPAERR